MTNEECFVAETIARVLTERDGIDNGDIEADFSMARAPGMLKGPATCHAVVRSRDCAGDYEVEIVVRRRA